MRRIRVPAFLVEVFAPRVPRNALIAGSLALAAASLDPKIWAPSMPYVLEAVRATPDLEATILVLAVLGAGLLLFGGALGDTTRARAIILSGLAVELAMAVVSLVVPEGQLFVLARFAGAVASVMVIPASLALVATAYSGTARATALGLAYAAYGGAQGLAPVLVLLVSGTFAPAFFAAIIASGIALAVCSRFVIDLPRPNRRERPYVFEVALWGFGIVLATSGLIWFGSGLDNPLRLGLIVSGAVVIGIGGLVEMRRRRGPAERAVVRFERRGVTVAVFVGIVIAVSQTVPMLQLPLFFQFVLGYGPFLATVALGPLFAALILAGPIAGFLLARYPPRTLVGAGVIAVGLGNLGAAVVIGRDAGYFWFVVPFLLIGAGFVVATTVRTAIIFASVPRGLPASAAGLNEASLVMGSRIGVVIVTALVTEVARQSYEASLSGVSGPDAAAALRTFTDLLNAIGTPSFAALLPTVLPENIPLYADAYATGIRVALLMGGVAAVVAGLIAWIALGRRDPLVSVWEHADERASAAAPSP